MMLPDVPLLAAAETFFWPPAETKACNLQRAADGWLLIAES